MIYILKLSILQCPCSGLFFSKRKVKMKKLIYAIVVIMSLQINAIAHEMQHGFILSNNDSLGSHLVANGHHSRQVEVVGQLTIASSNEQAFYRQRKENSAINQTYFLFQAQQLDLPRLTVGMTLTGHIVESRMGSYEPKNVIVKSATFRIQRILLNIPNPFFVSPEQPSMRAHCCEIPGKICNVKC